MKKVVICTVKNRFLGEPIVRQLQASGYANEDISILFPNDLAGTPAPATGHTKAPEGALAGGTVGMTLGFFAGLGAIALAIPGLGPFLAIGPIVVALTGAAAGATIGGVTGSLIGLGIPEKHAKRYEGHLRGGNLLISVHTDVNDMRAESIFAGAGAEDVYSTAEANAPPGQAVAHF